ncbi:hypothetical protein ADUPG1_002467, partial [Aduncisulcus paluster]
MFEIDACVSVSKCNKKPIFAAVAKYSWKDSELKQNPFLFFSIPNMTILYVKINGKTIKYYTLEEKSEILKTMEEYIFLPQLGNSLFSSSTLVIDSSQYDDSICQFKRQSTGVSISLAKTIHFEIGYKLNEVSLKSMLLSSQTHYPTHKPSRSPTSPTKQQLQSEIPIPPSFYGISTIHKGTTMQFAPLPVNMVAVSDWNVRIHLLTNNIIDGILEEEKSSLSIHSGELEGTIQDKSHNNYNRHPKMLFLTNSGSEFVAGRLCPAYSCDIQKDGEKTPNMLLKECSLYRNLSQIFPSSFLDAFFDLEYFVDSESSKLNIPAHVMFSHSSSSSSPSFLPTLFFHAVHTHIHCLSTVFSQSASMSLAVMTPPAVSPVALFLFLSSLPSLLLHPLLWAEQVGGFQIPVNREAEPMFDDVGEKKEKEEEEDVNDDDLNEAEPGISEQFSQQHPATSSSASSSDSVISHFHPGVSSELISA